jgi:hypothetical protein
MLMCKLPEKHMDITDIAQAIVFVQVTHYSSSMHWKVNVLSNVWCVGRSVFEILIIQYIVRLSSIIAS